GAEHTPPMTSRPGRSEGSRRSSHRARRSRKSSPGCENGFPRMSEPPGGNLPPPGSPPPPPQQYQPGSGQPYPYAPPYRVPDASGAVPAMVLGIISICALPLACCCGLGELVVIPLGIVAVLLGLVARNRVEVCQGTL